VTLKTGNGTAYQWPGGVGLQRLIVGFENQQAEHDPLLF
jgi:hypothetical protein